MIIALPGHKGGVGRTTVATHLASAASHHGLRPLLLDASHDGVAVAVASSGEAPRFTTLRLRAASTSAEEIGINMHALSVGHDLTLVDLSAHDDATARAVLEFADMALLVCTPSPLDAWTLRDTLELAGSMAPRNPRLIASVLLNRVDPRTSLGRDAADQLRRQGLPVLGPELRQRVAVVETMADPARLPTLDPEAGEEFAQLLTVLRRTMRAAEAEQAFTLPN